MANPNSQTGSGLGGRNKGESAGPDSQAPSSDKTLKPGNPLAAEQLDDEVPENEAEENSERSESDWGLAEKKPGMGREAKIAVLVILVLLSGFGIAVAKKMRDKNAAKAEQVEQAESEGSGEEPEKLTPVPATPPVASTTVPRKAPEMLPRENDEPDPFAQPPAREASASVAQSEPAANDNPFADAGAAAAPARVDSAATIVNLDAEASTPAEMEPAETPADAEFTPISQAPGQTKPVKQTAAETAEMLEPADSADPADSAGEPPVASNDLGEYRPLEEAAAEAASRTQVTQPPAAKTPLPSGHPARHRNSEYAPGYQVEEIASQQARGVTQVQRPSPGGTPSGRMPPRSPAAIDLDEFDPDAATGAAGAYPAQADPLFQSEQHLDARRQGRVPSMDAAQGAIGGNEYIVQPHDNYWEISKKRYGTHRYFMALEKHNAPQIPNPRQLRPGMKVQTPPREYLERTYSKHLPVMGPSQIAGYRGDGAGSVAAGPAGYFLSPNGEPMYRVGPLDTLTSISKDLLGRSSRWDEIYNLNRDTLPNADSLKIGTLLRLPSDASQHRLVANPRESQ